MRRGLTPSGRAKWLRDLAGLSEDLEGNPGSPLRRRPVLIGWGPLAGLW